MYDGGLAVELDDRSWTDDAVASDLLRLRRRFDPLLSDPRLPLDPDAARELETLARIHDLDEAIAPAELWRALRLMLAPSIATA